MYLQRSVLAIALASLALAALARAAPASCAPSAATTLLVSGGARVYSLGAQLYGCLGARRTRLGATRGSVPFPARRVALEALNSPYAGIDVVDMGVDMLASSVALVDLRTGASTATAAATTPERRPESFMSVTSMAVDRKGTLAWIGERSAVGAFTPVYEVHALSSSGNRLLASATNIAPKSLRLRGDTLSWRAGGRTRSATL
jgi:hypothetical protein